MAGKAYLYSLANNLFNLYVIRQRSRWSGTELYCVGMAKTSYIVQFRYWEAMVMLATIPWNDFGATQSYLK